MLAKVHRLKLKRDFDRVFKKGRGVSQDFLFLKLLPNDSAKSRFGIIVSQKISKKATERNKIRRRIRAAIFKKLPGLEDNFDAVIIALPGVEEKDFRTIEKTITELFKKARIIKEK